MPEDGQLQAAGSADESQQMYPFRESVRYLIKRTVHFRLTKLESLSSYNQSVYGNR